MPVALAFEVDDGTRAMETRVEMHEEEGVCLGASAAEADFLAHYEIETTVARIVQHGFARIALQFPDAMLSDAMRVQRILRARLGAQMERVFVLGDTSYGSCCVDEVAAQHLRADCIVHYGRSCLRCGWNMEMMARGDVMAITLTNISCSCIVWMHAAQRPRRQ